MAGEAEVTPAPRARRRGDDPKCDDCHKQVVSDHDAETFYDKVGDCMFRVFEPRDRAHRLICPDCNARRGLAEEARQRSAVTADDWSGDDPCRY